jgi:septum formation protein
MSFTKQIILASRSPRRVELLAQLGVQCQIIPADIDESARALEDPADYVRRLAQEKALAVAQRYEHCGDGLPILAADTTVALGMRILGKPENPEEAEAMLSALSGRKHQVHTAVALWHQGQVQCLLNTTQVEMGVMTPDEIAHYIASGEPFDKAGAYGIQGVAGRWIKHIEGSYTGVMGLPLFETAQLLSAW